MIVSVANVIRPHPHFKFRYYDKESSKAKSKAHAKSDLPDIEIDE